MNAPKRRETKLPLYRPWIHPDEIEAVAETLISGWIGLGKRVAEFEERFAETIGAEHAIAVNSCTAALHLSLVAAGIGEGDVVLTTPYTFTATAEAIQHTGATVRFVDIDPRTLNLRPEEVEAAITPDVKAIVPVHIAGLACDMVSLRALAQEHNLFLLDDAAHAFIAERDGHRIGAIGDATAFSFFPTKNLTTVEGGMVTTRHAALAEKLRRIRYHAFSRDTWQRTRTSQPWAYDIVETGYKCNMTDVQAALGLRQLEKVDRQRAIRERIASRYREAFRELPELDLPVEPENGRHAWHLYIVQLRPERLTIDRDAFVQKLNEWNIGALVHYIPLHYFTHYQRTCGVKPGDFPNAEAAFSRVVSLPLWPGMSDADTEDVIAAVTYLIEQHRR